MRRQEYARWLRDVRKFDPEKATYKVNLIQDIEDRCGVDVLELVGNPRGLMEVMEQIRNDTSLSNQYRQIRLHDLGMYLKFERFRMAR